MKLERIYTSETPEFSLDRQIKCFVPQLSKNFPCIHICLERKKSLSDSRELLGKLVRSFKIVVGNMEMKEDIYFFLVKLEIEKSKKKIRSSLSSIP